MTPTKKFIIAILLVIGFCLAIIFGLRANVPETKSQPSTFIYCDPEILSCRITDNKALNGIPQKPTLIKEVDAKFYLPVNIPIVKIKQATSFDKIQKILQDVKVTETTNPTISVVIDSKQKGFPQTLNTIYTYLKNMIVNNLQDNVKKEALDALSKKHIELLPLDNVMLLYALKEVLLDQPKPVFLLA